MSTQADGVIVFGHNSLGLLSIRVFPTWKKTLTYLDEHNLKVPQIDFVEPVRSVDIRFRHSDKRDYYRIFWKSDKALSPVPVVASKDSVMHAPDAESALVIYKFVQHSMLVRSNFGYSIPLIN